MALWPKFSPPATVWYPSTMVCIKWTIPSMLMLTMDSEGCCPYVVAVQSVGGDMGWLLFGFGALTQISRLAEQRSTSLATKSPPSELLLWASASDWWHTFESFHLKCVRSNSRWTKLCAHVCWKVETPPLQCDQNQIYFLGNKYLTHWVIHWLLGWFVTLKKWASSLELQLVITTFISHFYLGMQSIN